MIVGSNNFSAQFIKIIPHYKKISYNINVLHQTACLVVAGMAHLSSAWSLDLITGFSRQGRAFDHG